MHSIKLHVFNALLVATPKVFGYQPYPFDQYDPAYVSALRERLDSFHERLRAGIIPDDHYATDTQWNFDGNLVVGDKEWSKALRAVIGPVFGNLNISDYYEIVDGNICGTLFNLQGNQTGEFLGLPVQPGAHFNVHGSELWVFDENLEVSELITVQEEGRIRAQLAERSLFRHRCHVVRNRSPTSSAQRNIGI